MEWPDLNFLQLLVKVGECGSLGAAARAVDKAQPNASRIIRQMERSLGLRLINRSPRGSTLTEEGQMVADWAEQVLDAARRYETGVHALRSQHNSRLTVAASMTVAEFLVPSWLAQLQRENPDSTISLRVHNSRDVCASVQAGQSEVGFIESPQLPAGLHSVTVARDRLLVVASPGHPWALRDSPVTTEELAVMPLVVREPGSGTRTTLDRQLRRYSASPPALELNSNAAVLIGVAAGAGPAVLSELAAAPALRSGQVCRVPYQGPTLERRLRAIWRPPRQLSGAAGDLVNIAGRDIGSGQTHGR